MNPRFRYLLSLVGVISVALPKTGIAQGSTEYLGKLGIYGLDFTRTPEEYQESTPEIYRQSGFVAGSSSRYAGSSSLGKGLWAAKISSGTSYRVGLYDEPEFTSSTGYQNSTRVTLQESGYLIGSSNRYTGSADWGQAAWTANASTGITTRIGYFSSDYTRADGYQFSEAKSLTNSGYISGSSTRYSGSSTNGRAAWVANATTGEIVRAGYYTTPEFVRSSDSYQSSSIYGITESGYMVGGSARYSGATNAGVAVWAAHASTGTPTRIGLFSSPEFTSSADYQDTTYQNFTKSGFINGYSTRYNGSTANGFAVWTVDASTGVTHRIGLFAGPEFTRATDSYQLSEISLLPIGSTALTESGYTVGSSNRYAGSADAGKAGWVASATSGTTHRVGLYSGSEYTRTTNSYQYTQIIAYTESGYLQGISNLFNGNSSMGSAAWIANAATGVTHRVGLYGTPEFTSANNLQGSLVTFLTESGFAAGSSKRYFEFSGDSYENGQGAWVADAATGITHRVGFFNGSEFTSTDLATRSSEVASLTNSGYARGHSTRYNGNTANGSAAWIANARTGETVRIGLYGNAEFTRSSDSYESSTSQNLNESGYAFGSSSRFNGTASAGSATWVANGATGTTTRIGLYSGPEFTRSSDSYQESSALGMNEANYIRGTSSRYNGTAAAGTATWVADATTGITMRTGLTDAIHTRNDNYQFSQTNTFTTNGYATGYSRRYNGTSENLGQTAWIFDLTLNSQVSFELSVRASDGYAWSNIEGVTSSGIAYGIFTLFDGAETDLGYRAFVWSAEIGTIILDESVTGSVGPGDWDYLNKVDFITEDGYVIAVGPPGGMNESSKGVYVLQVVPEPNGLALLTLALGIFWFASRRAKSRVQSI